MHLIRVCFDKSCGSHRLEYDEFVKEFAKHLVLRFGERVDTYMTSAMQANSQPCLWVTSPLNIEACTKICGFGGRLESQVVFVMVHIQIELIPKLFLWFCIFV